ncbi:hypothetical protein V6N11_037822 [Hibiscus sabdariffa]|uniref:Uncharacterized protein n=2 Tax=Hibiscus sabdariffa TaxID=183260 RepID=A0ABR1ZCZ7_9ROSI
MIDHHPHFLTRDLAAERKRKLSCNTYKDTIVRQSIPTTLDSSSPACQPMYGYDHNSITRSCRKCTGDVAQMLERSLSMREALSVPVQVINTKPSLTQGSPTPSRHSRTLDFGPSLLSCLYIFKCSSPHTAAFSAASCSSSDDDRKYVEPSNSQNWRQVDEDFRVRGSGHFTLRKRRSNIDDLFSWAEELTGGKSVVKLWDNLRASFRRFQRRLRRHQQFSYPPALIPQLDESLSVHGTRAFIAGNRRFSHNGASKNQWRKSQNPSAMAGSTLIGWLSFLSGPCYLQKLQNPILIQSSVV